MLGDSVDVMRSWLRLQVQTGRCNVTCHCMQSEASLQPTNPLVQVIIEDIAHEVKKSAFVGALSTRSPTIAPRTTWALGLYLGSRMFSSAACVAYQLRLTL